MPHVHEKIDFIADVYIVHDGQVLLRKHDKYNIWLPVGGHIELDEDPNQAAIREVKEEVGLDVTLFDLYHDGNNSQGSTDLALIPPRFLNRHRINDSHEHISFVYFATTASTDINPGEGEKKDDIKWFTPAEIDDAAFGIIDRVRAYAHEAIKTLS